MEARRRAILVVFGGLAAGVILMGLIPGKSYPACNNSVAVGELAHLYDDQRLLHAVAVIAPYLLSDGLKGRYCLATVKWENGSQVDVPYEFYRGGRGFSNIQMHIDYNGGRSGPTYR